MSDGDVTEPRKATDVLLALEAKIDQLLHLSRSQDLNIKILSNKLNVLSEKFNTFAQEFGPDFSANVAGGVINPSPPAAFTPEIVSIPSRTELTVTDQPIGHRRTSRPETYVTEPSFSDFQAPTTQPELLYNPKKSSTKKAAATESVPTTTETQVKSPVIQRVLDRNNKVIFLANVEVINTETNTIVHTARTSSVGKWQASLFPGRYRINVKKQESVSKTKMQAVYEFQVTNAGTVLELPDLVAK